MGKIFGTDGARGLVNKELSGDLALNLGKCMVQVLKKEKKKEVLSFIIGSDTRISNDMLSHAVIAGILSEGSHVYDVGVLPTPAIAYLITKHQMDGGIVISASHNPAEYNGIKVLTDEGIKLSEELEEAIEEELTHHQNNQEVNKVGNYFVLEKGEQEYIEHLKSSIENKIDSIKILVDTANGAAYKTAQDLFHSLNANVDFINNDPDGYNINHQAGSTHIEILQEKVKEGGYDIGIAYDGDADRCILVDEKGDEIDGDYILAIVGKYLKEKGKLTGNTIVGTVMSNLGFIKFCESENIHFESTKVGDKYVLARMNEKGYHLGGEQSGHIIFKDYATTGDGELTSLQVLNIMSEIHQKLSVLKEVMTKYPQVLINVEVTKEGKEKYLVNTKIQEAIKEVENILKDQGRILVRPSGTENLIRVMIEGKNEDEIKKQANYLASVIEKELC